MSQVEHITFTRNTFRAEFVKAVLFSFAMILISSGSNKKLYVAIADIRFVANASMS